MRIKITTTIIYFWKDFSINQLKINVKKKRNIFSIIMLRVNETKVAKEICYGAKEPINI